MYIHFDKGEDEESPAFYASIGGYVICIISLLYMSISWMKQRLKVQ